MKYVTAPHTKKKHTQNPVTEVSHLKEISTLVQRGFAPRGMECPYITVGCPALFYHTHHQQVHLQQQARFHAELLHKALITRTEACRHAQKRQFQREHEIMQLQVQNLSWKQELKELQSHFFGSALYFTPYWGTYCWYRPQEEEL